MSKYFPLIFTTEEKNYADKVKLPWEVIQSYGGEITAKRMFGQTLTRLAERGGLSPQEALALLIKAQRVETYKNYDIDLVVDKINRIIKAEEKIKNFWPT